MNEMTNSHILVHEFAYFEPTSVEEVITLQILYGDRAQVLAGGTDLIVQMKMERIAPEYVIGLHKVRGLDKVTFGSDQLHIGALTPVRAIYDNSHVQMHYEALSQACAAFSSTQIQVMGTIGGNLCNGSPASDAAPALIALGAEVMIQGPGDEKRLPLDEFFLEPGKTALRKGQLLVAVVLPRPQQGTGSAFLKISRVAADIAKVNAAVMLVRDGGRIVDCRIAFGSVAPTPMRARRAETLLTGQPFSADLVLEAASVASEEVTPIADVRSTAWYRREIVRVLAHDGLHSAWRRVTRQRPAWPPEVQDPVRVTPLPPSSEPVAILSVPPTQKQQIELTVNGEKRQIGVMPNDLLLNVLREELQLTGAKYGCGIGECGACTVQMDGKPVLSCLVLAVAANGSDIVTVEGLRSPRGDLDPLQVAFTEHAAIQCGYCTPGTLMTAKSLLSENPYPTEDEVRNYLKGNLCRCTGYTSIVRAVMSCAHPQPGD